jgi:uncharacterized RDD family membrane protein YckC
VSTHPTHEVSPIPVEARGFQGRPAGLVTRFIANTVDAAVVVVVLVGAYLGWNGTLFFLDPRGYSFTEPRPVFTLTAFLLVAGCYLTLAWAFPQRTYGDHVMGLRVVGRKGRRPRFLVAAARAAFCVFFPVGLLWCVVNPHRRSIQDVVLRTAVVYDWRPRAARADRDGSPAGGEAGVPPTAGA